MTAKDWDWLAQEYDGHFKHPTALAENVITFDLLQDAGCSKGRVLDIACGTGLLLEYLTIPPGSYTGLDVSPGMLAEARRKFPSHDFRKGDMDRLAEHAPEAEYDSVVSTFGGLSYSVDPCAAVRGIARALRTGGRLFMQVLGPRYRRRNSHIVGRVGEQRSYHTWHPRELEGLFKGGWADVRVVGLHAIPDALTRFLSQEESELVLRTELRTIGHRAPELCYFQILTATRVAV